MQIIKDFPPNYEEIDARFGIKGKPIIFAWGDKIYNPDGAKISEELIAHEEVHCKQQDGQPEEWWKKYLVDDKFRFDQELAAHKVEYKFYCEDNKDRNARNRYLHNIAIRFSSPMYGSMANYPLAKKLIGT